MAYEESLAALADPTRRVLFEALRDGPASVTDLAQRVPVSRPAVSQHLKVLHDAGLVTVRAEGTRRLYRIEPQALVELRTWLDDYWSAAMNAFAAEVTDPKREN